MYIVLCSAGANFPQYIVGLSNSGHLAVAIAQADFVCSALPTLSNNFCEWVYVSVCRVSVWMLVVFTILRLVFFRL